MFEGFRGQQSDFIFSFWLETKIPLGSSWNRPYMASDSERQLGLPEIGPQKLEMKNSSSKINGP